MGYTLPKDLLEDVEIQTGKNYFNDYFTNKKNLQDTYRETTIDLYKMLITIKRNIDIMLKDPNKYLMNEESYKLLEELKDYRGSATNE